MRNLSFLIFLFIFATNPVYSQGTINVPGDYSTIQAAIDAAVNGDTVLVEDGLYYENINFKGKAITVASHFIQDGDSTHIDSTIIDGSQSSEPDTGSTVIFNSGEDASSILCGFTITGGTGTLDFSAGDVSGGGIYLFVSSATIKNNIIENNVISHNSYTNGGGIMVLDSDSTVIENNVIRNNTITGNEWSAGGGIAIYEWIQAGYVKVANNKIIGNTASDPNFSSGGGIEVNGGGLTNRINIISNYIKGNDCTGGETYAGGLDLYDCSPTVKNNLIFENSADFGGGILIDLLTTTTSKSYRNYHRKLSNQTRNMTSAKLNSSINLLASAFENNTVVSNSGNLEGGGVTIWNSSPQLMNFIVWGNTAPSDPQISGTADVQYSDIEGGHPGSGNIDQNPQMDLSNEYCTLLGTSPCIDAGNPDPIYFDVGAGGNPVPPANGTLINDIGHVGGPASLWYLWDWPMPVEDETTVLLDYLLMQNYPNPFNPSTTIKYQIPEMGFITLKVYDVLGHEIESLVYEEKPAGTYEITWYAENLSSGVYFYQLRTGDFIETKRMVLMK